MSNRTISKPNFRFKIFQISPRNFFSITITSNYLFFFNIFRNDIVCGQTIIEICNFVLVKLEANQKSEILKKTRFRENI